MSDGRGRQNLEERILILAPLGRDGPLAQRALEQAGMTALVCRDMGQLCAELAEGAGAALLTQEALAGAAGAQLIAALEVQPPWSDFPVVLFAGAELPELRALTKFTVLERPVRMRTLLSAVRSALRARTRQYQTRAMMEELRRSVQARDQFLAMLGHELRNPIAAVLTASELMERSGGEAFSRERQIIARQARHLGQLVDDLLDVARVTSGKINLRRTVVDLDALVRRLLPDWEERARQRHLTLSYQGSRTRIRVNGDPLRLEQVLANLVGNALKYTPANGRVEISLAANENEARLEVSDTGIGIDTQTLPRVFELFSQAQGALDRAQGGMGIGLTVVKRLVELHDGTVTARSEGLGRGSSFEVRLPLCREAASPAPGKRNGVARRRRVMLVEDNPDTRQVLQLALEQAGHEVVTSADGLNAFELARRQPPEAMLIDIGLPGQDGYDLAREVRSIFGRSVRLIALTGYGQADDRRRALEAGFDDHLTKPVDLETIEQALAFESAA